MVIINKVAYRKLLGGDLHRRDLIVLAMNSLPRRHKERVTHAQECLRGRLAVNDKERKLLTLRKIRQDKETYHDCSSC